jgi:O-antigen/teichoic acid export membrane protein
MKRILVNTGSNVTVVVVKLVITFVMTPVFVHNLGNYDYGIWEIMTAVLGYMGLLDIGMKPAISRFSAKYLAEKNQGKLQELYSTSFLFLAIVGILVCVFFAIWAMFWPYLLSENNEVLPKYTLLLFIVGAQLLIVFPGYVAESFLEGFQKYYLKNNITIFNSIVGTIILYYTIQPGNALVLLALVNAIGLSIKYIIYTYLLTRKSMGVLKPIFSLATMRSFKETVGFGVKSLIQGIASRIEIGTDTIVIGAFLGPAMVPFYAIPANIISYIRNIGWTLTHAFMPLFSEMQAKNEQAEIQQLYLTASRYVVALLLPICVGTALLGADFIGVWVGEQYQKDAEVIIFLLVLYMALPMLNPFSTRYLTAIDKHGLLTKLYPISAGANLLISIILVQYWGIIGVAIGSVIPVFIYMPVVLKSCCGFLGITVIRYLKECVVPALLPTIVMWSVVYLFSQSWLLDNYTNIVLAVTIGGSVYSIIYFMFSMTSKEREWLVSRCIRILQA